MVNEDVLVENLHETSVVAQVVVFNGIQFHGGVLKVPLTPELIQSVKSASNAEPGLRGGGRRRTGTAPRPGRRFGDR